jgi:hypothetical protein
VGRLDNIIARNRRPNRLQERVIVSTLLGIVVLLIIALAVFTDLGMPPGADNAGGSIERAPAAPHDGKHADGILLRRAAQAKAAAPAGTLAPAGTPALAGTPAPAGTAAPAGAAPPAGAAVPAGAAPGSQPGR